MGEQPSVIKINSHTLSLTHLQKLVWPDQGLTKAGYLKYLQSAAPLMLPFLKERALTVIRFPGGINAPSFFQKNCPDYAPAFIKKHQQNDRIYIVCSNLQTLIWLGNQLAIEFHVPFQTIEKSGPSEIVFDLDPPSRDAFDLSVRAAQLIKELLDKLHLHSFIKTSGNKGLQVYIPLPYRPFSYHETRIFTSFAASYLVDKEPSLFTTERLKKNRGGKLYLDIVQHAEGKTLIAPYSPRGNKEALVSTPLNWNEVGPLLRPEAFSIETVPARIIKYGNPFDNYFKVKKNQPFSTILNELKKEKKR